MDTTTKLRWIQWPLRLVTAAAFAVDAYVHADRAVEYDLNRDAAISQGDLFRIEAGVSAFLALLLLIVATRVVWALAILVAASAFGAVLLYAHVDIGALGPLPDMYEPLWYPKKTAAAVAEGVATGTALIGFGVAALRARSLAARRGHPAADAPPTNATRSFHRTAHLTGRAGERDT